MWCPLVCLHFSQDTNQTRLTKFTRTPFIIPSLESSSYKSRDDNCHPSMEWFQRSQVWKKDDEFLAMRKGRGGINDEKRWLAGRIIALNKLSVSSKHYQNNSRKVHLGSSKHWRNTIHLPDYCSLCNFSFGRWRWSSICIYLLCIGFDDVGFALLEVAFWSGSRWLVYTLILFWCFMRTNLVNWLGWKLSWTQHTSSISGCKQRCNYEELYPYCFTFNRSK